MSRHEDLNVILSGDPAELHTESVSLRRMQECFGLVQDYEAVDASRDGEDLTHDAPHPIALVVQRPQRRHRVAILARDVVDPWGLMVDFADPEPKHPAEYIKRELSAEHLMRDGAYLVEKLSRILKVMNRMDRWVTRRFPHLR